ncbi:MAG TPA: ABC transporter permease, partial [Saprospiraceae bacterium]|nr:ABC transporter permease [Saprospiraceae bacterium]
MLHSYFKLALRTLRKEGLYSLLNLMGLSIGIAACLLILLYTKDEVSYDRFHANNPNIYRIVSRWYNPDGSFFQGDGNTGNFPGPKFSEKIPEILSFVRLQYNFYDVRRAGEVKGYEMINADTTFFSIFSFPFVSGDSRTALQNPNGIVITEKTAENFFGKGDALGKTIEIKQGDEFVPRQVTGVVRNCPQNSTIKFDFAMPLTVPKEEYANHENWFNFFQNTFVLLVPNANVATVEDKMKQIYESDAADVIQKMATKYEVKESCRYGLQAFSDIHLSTEMRADNGLKDASSPVFSYILTGIALFILLIACINFVNLTIARSLKRARETGVRKAIGGSRGQLATQFLSESFLFCGLAFLSALGLVELALPTFNRLADKSLALSYLFDWKLVTGFIAVFLFTGLLAGFYPALFMSRFSPVQALYGRARVLGKNYLQKGLVVLQFALASFLIIATLTIFKQFNYLINKDLGYDDKDMVIVTDLFGIKRDKFALFKNELLKDNNILGVAPKNGGSWGTRAKVNGDDIIEFAYETVDEDYLPLFKIPVSQGRNFSRDFPSDSSMSVLVNEAFVKKAGWVNPLGQVVDFWHRTNEKYTVIGVVKDHHYESLKSEIKPQLFTMKAGNPFGMVNVKIRPGSETASLAHIAIVYKNMFP